MSGPETVSVEQRLWRLGLGLPRPRMNSREVEVKYMILTFGDQSGLAGKPPEWLKEMIAFMVRIDAELREAGELVFQQGLADASEARTVTVRDGAPVATDGPFAASAESLAGFWIVDVEDEARAIEIAAGISEAADAPIEVRACLDAPPDDLARAAG